MISKEISKQINSLTSIGAEKQVSDTLRKIIRIRIKEYEKKLEQLNSDLKTFEHKFNQKSEIFYHQFNKGSLGDDMDFMEWAGLYENYILFQSRMNTLSESL